MENSGEGFFFFFYTIFLEKQEKSNQLTCNLIGEGVECSLKHLPWLLLKCEIIVRKLLCSVNYTGKKAALEIPNFEISDSISISIS